MNGFVGVHPRPGTGRLGKQLGRRAALLQQIVDRLVVDRILGGVGGQVAVAVAAALRDAEDRGRVAAVDAERDIALNIIERIGVAGAGVPQAVVPEPGSVLVVLVPVFAGGVLSDLGDASAHVGVVFKIKIRKAELVVDVRARPLLVVAAHYAEPEGLDLINAARGVNGVNGVLVVGLLGFGFQLDGGVDVVRAVIRHDDRFRRDKLKVCVGNIAVVVAVAVAGEARALRRPDDVAAVGGVHDIVGPVRADIDVRVERRGLDAVQRHAGDAGEILLIQRLIVGGSAQLRGDRARGRREQGHRQNGQNHHKAEQDAQDFGFFGSHSSTPFLPLFRGINIYNSHYKEKWSRIQGFFVNFYVLRIKGTGSRLKGWKPERWNF